jgi:hypothetical protein
MNSQLSIFATLLKKDILLFWQFATVIAGLIVLLQFPAAIVSLGQVGQILRIATLLGTVLFVLVVFYEDAVVSLKHDWLTRPIYGTTSLFAKLAFVFMVIVAPAIVGVVAKNLYEGHSWGESLLEGLSIGVSGSTLMTLVFTMAFAALTSGIRQAVVALLAATAFVAVVAMVAFKLFMLRPPTEESGSGWIVVRTLLIMLTSAGLFVLWIQYHFRHNRAARSVVASAVVAAIALMSLVTWPRVFSAQKALSPDPEAASTVRLELAAGCFPSRLLDTDREAALPVGPLKFTAGVYSEAQRKQAGPGAIALATQLVRRDIPPGHRLSIGHFRLTHHARNGDMQELGAAPTSRPWSVDGDGQLIATQHWLMSREEFNRMSAAPDVETHINYSLSLLAPKATGVFLADGHRTFYRGIGYCGATLDRGAEMVIVDCFKAGDQPAQLVAGLSGAPEEESRASDVPDYTPASLDFWGGKRHTMRIGVKGVGVPQVTVTAYEARVHFDRRLVVPGVLGGPTSVCPLPL